MAAQQDALPLLDGPLVAEVMAKRFAMTSATKGPHLSHLSWGRVIHTLFHPSCKSRLRTSLQNHATATVRFTLRQLPRTKRKIQNIDFEVSCAFSLF